MYQYAFPFCLISKFLTCNVFQQMRRYVKCMILARYSLDDNVEMAEIATNVSSTFNNYNN